MLAALAVCICTCSGTGTCDCCCPLATQQGCNPRDVTASAVPHVAGCGGGFQVRPRAGTTTSSSCQSDTSFSNVEAERSWVRRYGTQRDERRESQLLWLALSHCCITETHRNPVPGRRLGLLPTKPNNINKHIITCSWPGSHLLRVRRRHYSKIDNAVFAAAACSGKHHTTTTNISRKTRRVKRENQNQTTTTTTRINC